MSTLHHLVSEGKVRYLAASSMWTFQLAQLQHVAALNGWTRIVAMQSHYNLIYREEEREMIKFCKETGIGVLSASYCLSNCCEMRNGGTISDNSL